MAVGVAVREDLDGGAASGRLAERACEENLVAYDPRRHQDTIHRRRRSPFARADLSAYLYFFISLL